MCTIGVDNWQWQLMSQSNANDTRHGHGTTYPLLSLNFSRTSAAHTHLQHLLLVALCGSAADHAPASRPSSGLLTRTPGLCLCGPRRSLLADRFLPQDQPNTAQVKPTVAVPSPIGGSEVRPCAEDKIASPARHELLTSLLRIAA